MRIFLFLFVFIFSFNLPAQKIETGPVVKAGVSWYGNNINHTHIFDCTPSFSYSLGWDLRYNVFKRVGIATQLELKKTGAKDVVYSIDPSFLMYDNIDNYYACLPLKLYVLPVKNFSVELGGKFSYRFSSSISRSFSNTEIGLLGALQYSYKKFGFGLEYYTGISPLYTVVEVLNTSSKYSAVNFELYNHNLYFTIRYIINKKVSEK